MHLVDCLTADPGVKSQLTELSHIIFVEIDNEIISKVILPLLLFQEGQLSVTGKCMCTKYCLTTELSLPMKSVNRLSAQLHMT